MRSLLWLGCVLWIVVAARATSTAQAVPAAPGPHSGVAFETSDNCMACHNGLLTPSGEDASIGVQWRASMMANSARDPYWQASVRREILDHPSQRRAIEDECAVCHMPMAHTVAKSAGRETDLFGLLAADGAGAEHRLAADGVSCTLCHQITAQGLGTPATFTGQFVLDRQAGATGPRMFGPFEVASGLASVMRSAAAVQPAQGEYMRDSALCATCHTLYTRALDASGAVIGTLPEQVPFLEWQHSAYAAERSCQGCHMPAAAATPIASVLGEPRERMGRHTFLGGNFLMLRMLARYRQPLGVVAPALELERAADATIRQLAADTAEVALTTTVSGGRLAAEVAVRNLTGHKLPTGYPARRAWLHLVVRDRDGRAVFESGAVTAAGAIVGNDGDADAARFEPHHDVISAPGEVQVYESVMGDSRGLPTTGLLQGVSFLKDNRLLPKGFDKATAAPDIAVRGEAAADRSFTGEGDRVRYEVALGDTPGPYRVEVVLRYQPIAFRWAENLRRYDAAEPRRFLSYFDAMAGASAAVLARATADVTRN